MVHADDVAYFKYPGMTLKLLTEDGAADVLVRLISNLQTGAEVWTQNISGLSLRLMEEKSCCIYIPAMSVNIQFQAT